MKLNPFERIETSNLINNDETLEVNDELDEKENEAEAEAELENPAEHEAPGPFGGVSLEERNALTK